MLNFDVKRKINTLRDVLVGKVPDPKAQVEQITIALIYKFMDDMDLQAAEFGGDREFFKNDYSQYAFSQIMLPEHSAQDRLNLYAEGIDKMTNNPDLPKLFRDILRNAYIPYRDPETLNRFLREIAEFSYEDSEELGNAFEYLLSIMGSQGDAGQFRTPRHIIDMMVEITAPAKNESILDPACGTAGFLISAYNYIKKSNLDEHFKSTLVADDMTRMTKNFAGYDISPDMVRLSRVNMYLHGFTSPNISEYDTLTSLEKWDDNYDVIFSNPPFMTPKGGITPHNRYQVSAKRAEVLFVDYIAEHLNPTGRAAIIVPEGIVFQSQTAYKNLRKMLVEGNYLYGVISLPAGVFNPYSGVKTSILLIDRTLAKERDSILFVKLNNDGFDLGAQRREIKGSEIPDVINTFKEYQKGVDVEGRKNIVLVKKSEIIVQDYILVGERYDTQEIVSGNYPMIRLGDVCTFIRGLTYNKDDESSVPTCNTVLRANNIDLATSTLSLSELKYLSENVDYGESKKVQFNDILICASSGSKEHLGKVALIPKNCDMYFGGFMGVLRHNERIMPKYLFYCLTSDRYKGFIQSLISGVNINNIRSAELLNFLIPLPPLNVQEEIVAEIEGYQKIIDGARQVVENYKPTIKIDPAWETVKLGSVFKLSSGRGLPSKDRENGIFNVYGGNGITGHHKEFFVEEPTIVIGRVGEYCGATHVTTPKCWVTDNALMATDFYVDVDLMYLWAMLNNLNLRQYAKVGGQPSISQMTVYERSIPLPPIAVQHLIVDRMEEEMSIVDQNKHLIEIFQQKIKDKINEVWGE